MKRNWVLPEEMPRFVNKKLFVPVPGTPRLGVIAMIFTGAVELRDGYWSVFEMAYPDGEQPYSYFYMQSDGVVPLGNYNSYLFRNFWLAYAHGLDWNRHYNPEQKKEVPPRRGMAGVDAYGSGL